MKYKFFTLTFVILANIGTIMASEGVLPGLFSVSPDKKVQFSQGNLQYQASTGTWRFAENQWNLVGNGTPGPSNVYVGDTKCSNESISSTYSGWIDLFGWGTGCNPTNVSFNSRDYSTFTDWGVNAISNGGNEANLWHTLTKDEWVYLFSSRENATTLFGFGIIDDRLKGIIILPDNWVLPDGSSYSSSGSNYYSFEEWTVMESAGAVFLPAAGFRSGTSTGWINQQGYYWSATPNDAGTAFYLYFSYKSNLSPQSYDGRTAGFSVRLVQVSKDATTKIDNASVGGSFSKILRDGQILILRGDKTYTLTGQELK